VCVCVCVCVIGIVIDNMCTWYQRTPLRKHREQLSASQCAPSCNNTEPGIAMRSIETADDTACAAPLACAPTPVHPRTPPYAPAHLQVPEKELSARAVDVAPQAVRLQAGLGPAADRRPWEAVSPQPRCCFAVQVGACAAAAAGAGAGAAVTTIALLMSPPPPSQNGAAMSHRQVRVACKRCHGCKASATVDSDRWRWKTFVPHSARAALVVGFTGPRGSSSPAVASVGRMKKGMCHG
jgi:hypothetical protein